MGSLEYHFLEMDIAQDKSDTRHTLPEVLESDECILDIGCGIGQSIVALGCPGKTCIGLDIDEEAVKYGMEHYGENIQFLLSDASRIPVASNTVDLAFSRVSLPYTNIPKAVKEIKRVLKDGGRIWLTLHEKHIAMSYLRDSMKHRHIRRFVHVLYILANGYMFKCFKRVVPYLNGSYESWQDPKALVKLLNKHGFTVKISREENHTIVAGSLAK